MIDFDKLEKDILDLIKSRFTVKNVYLNFEDEFYYHKIINLLKFNISQYEVENLGNLAILRCYGLNIVNMITVVFTPNKKLDIPFVIVDFIKMANQKTVFVEFYLNHMKDKQKIEEFEYILKKVNYKYSTIEDYIETPQWYTPLRSEYSPLKKMIQDYEDDRLYKMVLENIEKYLDYVGTIKPDEDYKNEELESFINDLIYKGNPSTKIFEKSIGKEETIRLFKEIIFYYN